jgi:hypothetical protein
MKIICAWCKLDMGEKEPFERKEITHAICSRCQKKVMAEMEHYEMSQRPIVDQIREINFKGAVYELAKFIVTLALVAIGTFLVSSLIPME